MPAILINNEIYGNTPDDKQQEIISVINQASKSWMVPTDIEIAHQGIGVPSIDVVSGAYYLDVVSGNVYLGGTEWTLDRMLTSAQEELETITSNLESMNAVKSATVPQNSEYISSAWHNQVIRVGKLCIYNYSLRTAAIPAWSTSLVIGTIPEGFRPINNSQGKLENANASGALYSITVQEGGAIVLGTVGAIQATDTITGQIVYVCP